MSAVLQKNVFTLQFVWKHYPTDQNRAHVFAAIMYHLKFFINVITCKSVAPKNVCVLFLLPNEKCIVETFFT